MFSRLKLCCCSEASESEAMNIQGFRHNKKPSTLAKPQGENSFIQSGHPKQGRAIKHVRRVGASPSKLVSSDHFNAIKGPETKRILRETQLQPKVEKNVKKSKLLTESGKAKFKVPKARVDAENENALLRPHQERKTGNNRVLYDPPGPRNARTAVKFTPAHKAARGTTKTEPRPQLQPGNDKATLKQQPRFKSDKANSADSTIADPQLNLQREGALPVLANQGYTAINKIQHNAKGSNNKGSVVSSRESRTRRKKNTGRVGTSWKGPSHKKKVKVTVPKRKKRNKGKPLMGPSTLNKPFGNVLQLPHQQGPPPRLRSNSKASVVESLSDMFSTMSSEIIARTLSKIASRISTDENTATTSKTKSMSNNFSLVTTTTVSVSEDPLKQSLLEHQHIVKDLHQKAHDEPHAKTHKTKKAKKIKGKNKRKDKVENQMSQVSFANNESVVSKTNEPPKPKKKAKKHGKHKRKLETQNIAENTDTLKISALNEPMSPLAPEKVNFKTPSTIAPGSLTQNELEVVAEIEPKVIPETEPSNRPFTKMEPEAPSFAEPKPITRIDPKALRQVEPQSLTSKEVKTSLKIEQSSLGKDKTKPRVPRKIKSKAPVELEPQRVLGQTEPNVPTKMEPKLPLKKGPKAHKPRKPKLSRETGANMTDKARPKAITKSEPSQISDLDRKVAKGTGTKASLDALPGKKMPADQAITKESLQKVLPPKQAIKDKRKRIGLRTKTMSPKEGPVPPRKPGRKSIPSLQPLKNKKPRRRPRRARRESPPQKVPGPNRRFKGKVPTKRQIPQAVSSPKQGRNKNRHMQKHKPKKRPTAENRSTLSFDTNVGESEVSTSSSLSKYKQKLAKIPPKHQAEQTGRRPKGQRLPKQFLPQSGPTQGQPVRRDALSAVSSEISEDDKTLTTTSSKTSLEDSGASTTTVTSTSTCYLHFFNCSDIDKVHEPSEYPNVSLESDVNTDFKETPYGQDGNHLVRTLTESGPRAEIGELSHIMQDLEGAANPMGDTSELSDDFKIKQLGPVNEEFRDGTEESPNISQQTPHKKTQATAETTPNTTMSTKSSPTIIKSTLHGKADMAEELSRTSTESTYNIAITTSRPKEEQSVTTDYINDKARNNQELAQGDPWVIRVIPEASPKDKKRDPELDIATGSSSSSSYYSSTTSSHSSTGS